MPKFGQTPSGGVSLKQQIFLLEQRVLGRRYLLHHQVTALRQGLHQKVARSINVFIVSSVAIVLGYFAARRILATSSTPASAPAASSANTASSSLIVRPAGVFVTFVVSLLRSFAKGMFFLASMLRFFVFFMDAVGIAKLIASFSSPATSNSAPVVPAEPAAVNSFRVANEIKTKPWLLWGIVVACVTCALFFIGWFYVVALI